MSKNAAAHAQVPTELWCLIWGFLSMEDSVAVSQTCSAWRYAALNCPQLWCEVDFASSSHSDGCVCIPCYRGVPAFSNLALVGEVLYRSAELPLALTVHSLHDDSNFEELQELIRLLRPNVHRLRELRFLTWDEMVPSYFLAYFDVFPALRVLTVLSDADDQVYNALFDDPLQELPVLQQLEIRGCFFYAGMTLHLTSPMLALSSLTLGFSDTLELVDCLAMCPGLEYLRLQMPLRHSGDELASNYDRVRAAMDRPLAPIAVDVFELSQSYEGVILHMFNTPFVKKLGLSYARTMDSSRRPSTFGIVRVIERPTTVSVTSQTRINGKYLVVLAKDDHGRERSVAVPQFPMAKMVVSTILVHIQVGIIPQRSVFVDARLWGVVVPRSLMVRATTSLTLSFPVDKLDDLDFDAIPEVVLPMISLRELRITTHRQAAPYRGVERIMQSWKNHKRISLAKASASYRPIRLPPGYLQRLIQSLKLPGRLEMVSIDPEVELDSEDNVEAELADLTGNVCYRRRAIP